jgi:hypothetical protein
MSRQAKTKLPNKEGKIRAAKSNEMALAVKGLWSDVDVGPKTRFVTILDAIKAVKQFCQTTGVPLPTAIGVSGGGLHLHWISNRQLTIAEWRPYAEGLKSLLMQHKLAKDTGITTDSARILRVPGTFNYKTTPAKPVKLIHLAEKDLDFATDLAMLPTVAPTISVSSSNRFFDPAVFPRGGHPSPLFASLPEETLSEGLAQEYDVIDLKSRADYLPRRSPPAAKTSGNRSGTSLR